ncbi:unnamed protein product [Ectocarpus sp. CCAP 1310/34]|nr:unnamed protein product [Ectocarpus sp. CCAP 1310/34]
MVAIPVLKLFSMTVKTLAKPMARKIRTEAQRHPRFRGVLNSMGQATNRISARISIRLAGHTTTKIKPLEEDKAIADGGNMLAEGFIYGLGTSLMVFEYMSNAKDKEAKEAISKLKKEEEKREIAQALEDINRRLARLEALDRTGNRTHEVDDGADQRKWPLGLAFQAPSRKTCVGDSTPRESRHPPDQGGGDASTVGGGAGSRNEHQGSRSGGSGMRGSGGDTDEANGERNDYLWRQEDEEDGEGERGTRGVSPWEMLLPTF